jgi:hypothetical protein
MTSDAPRIVLDAHGELTQYVGRAPRGLTLEISPGTTIGTLLASLRVPATAV